MVGIRARNIKLMRNHSMKKSGKANETLGSVLISTARSTEEYISIEKINISKYIQHCLSYRSPQIQ
jgi:hypothetical protein